MANVSSSLLKNPAASALQSKTSPPLLKPLKQTFGATPLLKPAPLATQTSTPSYGTKTDTSAYGSAGLNPVQLFGGGSNFNGSTAPTLGNSSPVIIPKDVKSNVQTNTQNNNTPGGKTNTPTPPAAPATSTTPQPTPPQTQGQPAPPAPFQTAVGTLNGIAQGGDQNYGLLQDKIRQIRENAAKAVADTNTTGADLGFKQGADAQIRNTEIAKEGALGNEATALLGEQGQQISAAQGAGSLAKPNAEGYPFVFDPVTGQYKDVTGGKYGDGIMAQQNIQIAKNFEGDYQTGLAKLKAADGIGQQVISTLQANPSLNSQPLSALNNLKELLSGQISSGPQQLLSQQVAQYIQALGLDPGTVFQIAHQSQNTLAQLLDSLRQTAQATVDSKNPAGLNFSGGSQNTQGLSGSSSEILSKYGIN